MNRRDRLSEWLKAYRSADPVESDYRLQMLTLLESAGDPFSREHLTPGHFTASAFVLGDPAMTRGASPEAEPGLLMIFHAKLNRWLQPGGHVEPGDLDLQAAAEREILEETGVRDVRPAGDGRIFDLDIHTIPGNDRQPEHQHLDVRFLFRTPAGSVVPATDAAAARWVAPAEAAALNREPAMTRVLLKLQSFLETSTPEKLRSNLSTDFSVRQGES